MSELFYSAAELAAMQLPNFPTTRQAVDYRAKREGWHVTVKKGIGARGRLNVYALNDLPKDLRTAIQAKTASDLLEKAKESKPVVRRPSVPPMPHWLRVMRRWRLGCAAMPPSTATAWRWTTPARPRYSWRRRWSRLPTAKPRPSTAAPLRPNNSPRP